MAGGKKGDGGPITIKKYANRRLYNTATSSYVTLEHLRDMVKEGVEFNVYDAKSSEDITRSVLAQIIFEEEGKGGQTMLPIQFLRQLIRFYGDRLQSFVPGYLKTPFGGFEDLARQNVQMFQRALKMFTPFGRFGQPGGAGETAESRPVSTEPARGDPDEISELKLQLDAMKQQLDELANRSK